MLEEMLRAEAASAIEHCALPNRRLRTQILDINSCGVDEEQNRKSRPDEEGIENGTMVGIKCGIKIGTENMFEIAIRNSAEVGLSEERRVQRPLSAFSNEAPRATVFRWLKEFGNGRNSLRGDAGCGTPTSDLAGLLQTAEGLKKYSRPTKRTRSELSRRSDYDDDIRWNWRLGDYRRPPSPAAGDGSSSLPAPPSVCVHPPGSRVTAEAAPDSRDAVLLDASEIRLRVGSFLLRAIEMRHGEVAIGLRAQPPRAAP
ncbi:hypothetical protein EVAR_78565_1 [Eumeta japonica]|uniref:Uncharacterized protein n=1 Tax=Eumeta variegata TaxID=151549 RepID=A0A4C1W8N4_EUMVA|nr:hypothetical protein EVAR_78565_1 [Eumeta japonica]